MLSYPYSLRFFIKTVHTTILAAFASSLTQTAEGRRRQNVEDVTLGFLVLTLDKYEQQSVYDKQQASLSVQLTQMTSAASQ